MKPSLVKAVVLNIAAKLGMVSLPASFPYGGMDEINALHRQSILDQLAAYKEYGVKWYRVRTSGDTCPKCRAHAGEEFRVEEAVSGVTLPPFYDCCNCSIVPADNE